MPEEKKLGEMEVLLDRNQCPMCGSEHSIFKDTVAQEVAAGRFSEMMAASGVGIVTTGLVADPTRQVLSAPQVIVIKDVCLNPDCGAEYVCRVSRVRVQISVQQQQGQPKRSNGPGDFMQRGGRF
jgi:hypothetical protein